MSASLVDVRTRVGRAARHNSAFHRRSFPVFSTAVKPAQQQQQSALALKSQSRRQPAQRYYREPYNTVVCFCVPADEVILPEEQDFDLLSNKVAELQGPLQKELRGCSIYLIGMMGSGKSTLGKMLGNTLKYAFFDTDALIEATHEKKPVSDIFKEYGEEYFRRCEGQVLQQLSPYKDLVVATGGGAVKDPYNWSYMRNGIVVWLNGDAELLTRRVLKDGPSKRPLLYNPSTSEEELYTATLNKLSSILQERVKYYENADVVVDISGNGPDKETGAPTAVVMYRVLQAVSKKVFDTKKEKEEKKNAVQSSLNQDANLNN